MDEKTCSNCARWRVRAITVYDLGQEVVTTEDPDGFGHCYELNQRTAATFGCNKFERSDWNHVEVTRKTGAPWHHFNMINCPDCVGRGTGLDQIIDHVNGAGMCRRCMGTGKVRRYDDGFIGEERTRKHPEEVRAEEYQAQEKRRAAAQAVLDGLPPPQDNKPTFDGRDLAPKRSDGKLATGGTDPV